jgi:acetylornithine/N-succinyldiaminopimelate aminotransferase
LDADYLAWAQKLCHERDILFVADEVQSGIGRSGAFLACDLLGVKPDMSGLAKGLAGGVPIGAIVTGPKCSDVLKPGDHGTTFGGNPLAAAAARVVLAELAKPGFLSEVTRKGQKIVSAVKSWNSPIVKDVRGLGLMRGIGVTVPPGDVVTACRENKVLVLTAGDDTVRLLPPLVVTDEELDTGLAAMQKAFAAVSSRKI